MRIAPGESKANPVLRWMGLGLWVQLLAGCASYSTQELANPTALHEARLQAGGTPTDTQTRAQAATDLVPLRYYRALDAARADQAPQAAIDSYVREGAALVELYCERWFSRVAQAQRQAQLTDNNRNIITQLGTAAIGLGRLHSDVTAIYGALNTGITGFNANFNTSFLAAPNAENVKRLTLEAVRSRGELLRSPTSLLYPKDFSRAYVELEKLASTCTYPEVRKLTTKSVDQSTATADPRSGEPVVTAIATIAQGTTLKPRVSALLDRIDGLKPGQATAFTRVMPFRNADAIAAHIRNMDPNGVRFSSDSAAKSVLKSVVTQTTANEAQVNEWEARLDLLAD